MVSFSVQTILRGALAAVACVSLAVPALAQSPVVFVPGTGAETQGAPEQAATRPAADPRRPTLACANLSERTAALLANYRAAPPRLALAALAQDSLTATPPWPAQRLDPTLLRTALASFARHNCANPNTRAIAQIFVIDFAKRSEQPRLYRVDLRSGDGLDTPYLVAHGIGSDPDDDGLAQNFGNVQDSLMSSLGAARGAELYDGINGRSLRLDGLDSSNYAMRARDIVVHSYAPSALRYFSATYRNARGGKPGTSEGCFVVEPGVLSWLFAGLADGGFLYAGLGGDQPVESAKPASHSAAISFVPGTGQ